MSDHLQALFDRIAVQDEHSHVPYDARRTIAEVILRTDHLDVLESARLAVRELDQKALAQVLADWIDARVSI